MGEAVKRVYPRFSASQFDEGLAEELEPLELKQRMKCLARRLEAGLPTERDVLFDILVKTLAVDETDVRGLRGFQVWPLTEIVANRGLDHFSGAMAALAEMTQRFTAEFAIRPFLLHDLDKSMRQLHVWCAHPSEHVRRLVSEGSRPYLPWGGNLPMLLNPPLPTLKLLEKLHGDPSDYVRLSVANHLNDLSKKHPETVLTLLRRWRDAAPEDARLVKLARHACRTLLKAGHPGALEFHGFHSAEALELIECRLGESTVTLGSHLSYHLTVRNTSAQPLRVMFDYAIYHRKANGSQSPKVFKGRIFTVPAGETVKISGKHPFKQITTRVYHTGSQGFEPLLNGRPFPRLEFTLEI
jgi:3-methyladenine DNA glycosylase AlkC